jgi:hypothetical protein
MGDVIIKPSIYAVPGIPYQIMPGGRRTIIKAIAEAWDIPEDKVLGNTEVTPKKHDSAKSASGERKKEPGERQVEYVNARKFYFYVMVKIEKYRWKELTNLTGRKIALMRYASNKAQEHMRLEPEYMERAKYVLDLIKADLIIFPNRKKPKLDATTTIGDGVSQATPPIQLSETGQCSFD